MKRKVCAILTPPALLLVYSINATAAWAVLSMMFAYISLGRSRSIAEGLSNLRKPFDLQSQGSDKLKLAERVEIRAE